MALPPEPTAIHPGMFGQMVVMRRFGKYGVLTQICGNHFLVLKAAPPVVVDQRHCEHFADALDAVMQDVHSSAASWTDALAFAQRVL